MKTFWNRPAVLLCGPVNAGKSTLFNALSSSRRAIVSNTPGTTRDINSALISWNKKTFTLLDAGGIDVDVEKEIDSIVKNSVAEALRSVDIALFVCDGQKMRPSSLASIHKKYRKFSKDIPWFLVINKIDSNKIQSNIDPSWYQSGMKGPFFISALKGRGTGDLLDEINDHLKACGAHRPKNKRTKDSGNIRISIIGKPNVGKSSLMNCLCGAERSIVSSLPHTTRDAQEMTLTYFKNDLTVTDTAGMRRHAKLGHRIRAHRDPHSFIERKSVQKTIRNILDSDICLFVLDASKKITTQDIHIAGDLERKQKPVIILANKWDLLEKGPKFIYQYEKYIRSQIRPLSWAPIIFVSATKKIRIADIFKAIFEVYNNYNRVIPIDRLNDFVHGIITHSLGKNIVTLKQIGQKPPQFLVSAQKNHLLPVASFSWLENSLRKHFEFSGTSISITTKKLHS